ncbi:MAG: hypothetical protein ACK2UB_11700, partial [Anaerolineales bacterium]
MIPNRPPSNPPPHPSDRLLPALLLAAALAAWLALAPILSLAAGMLLFDYVPASFEIIPLVPRPGALPQPAIGLILS